MSGTHQAAVIPASKSRLQVQERSTPEPGPDEILIEVKAVAVNPVDTYQRDFGFPPLAVIPTVLGSDVAGKIAKVGSNVSGSFTVGARVLAFASGFFHKSSPDHGAFQQYTLARWEVVTPIPDSVSFEEGAILPMAVSTALTAWTVAGIALDSKHSASEAVLVWGGSSSVGTLAVQSAKSLGFTVYTTASSQHHEYLKSLGADAVFDYKASDVVSQIIERVKSDGVTIVTAHPVVENCLQQVLDVVKGSKRSSSLMIIPHSPVLPKDHPTLEGTEVIFQQPPTDPDARNKHYVQVFQVWLKNGLANGTVKPSPAIKTVPGGLDGVNVALDTLKGGVSGTKIVVPL